jgi:hypothetical protein
MILAAKSLFRSKEYSPVAWILRFTSGESNLRDQYVTQEGKFIGTKDLFTPRASVVSGSSPKTEKIYATPEAKP